MGALTQARMGIKQTLDSVSLPLDSAQKAFIGGIACGDTSNGSVKPAQASTTLIRIGEFEQNVDNSAGTTAVQVLVKLERTVHGRWYDNATGSNKVLATSLFSDVYMADDHTVTLNSSGNSKAGRVWAVDAVKGVLVEAYTL